MAMGGRGEREIENMQLSNAFTWQQRLHECLSMLRHVHILFLQYTKMDVMLLNDTLAGHSIYDDSNESSTFLGTLT